MGIALKEKGKSFHGVLHICTKDDMIMLDDIESGYTRTKAIARLYDGSQINCTVYSGGWGKSSSD